MPLTDNERGWAALRGMGMVSAGLIAATGNKVMAALARNVMGWRMCALLATATFIAIDWLRWPLAWVLLGLGGAGFAWAYRCLGEPSTSDASGRSP